MQILEIRNNEYQIGAIMNVRSNGTTECSLIDGIRLHQHQRRASVNRILASFDRMSKEGLSSLNASQFHLANRENGVYEFIGGDLRVMFFKASSGKIVICTHMLVKQGNKASPQDVARVVEYAKAYKLAETAGDLFWLKEYKQ